MNLASLQQALATANVDGWLLYDFRHSNPIACRVAGIAADRHTTRRWFGLIPRTGEPAWLHSAIEAHVFKDLPGRKTAFVGWRDLEEALARMLYGRRRVAMEYSPRCAIPYVARVDAGTIELVRAMGVEVVSSADLVQTFERALGRGGPRLARARGAPPRRDRDPRPRLGARGGPGRRHDRRDRGPAPHGEGVRVARPDHERAAHRGPERPCREPALRAHAGELGTHHRGRHPAHRPVGEGDWRGRRLRRHHVDGVRGQGRDAGGTARVGRRDGRARRGHPAGRGALRGRSGRARRRGGRRDARPRRRGRARALLHPPHGAFDRARDARQRRQHRQPRDARRPHAHPDTGFSIEPGVYQPAFGVRSEIDMYVDGEGRARVSSPIQRALPALLA